jgi:hypothetical protein
MKQLLLLLVLAGLGYVGWTSYQGNTSLPIIGAREESVSEPPVGHANLPAIEAATSPAPVFKSRIQTSAVVADGDKQVAPPGVLYMLERVSAETPSGVMAVVPGDEVKLVARNGKKLRVVMGGTEFEVNEAQVTNDVAAAQEAERREFLRRNSAAR